MWVLNMAVESIFGLQVRRVADLIGEQGRDAFCLTGIELDAKLISIVVALFETPDQSSTDLCNLTGLSRQLVESRLKRLEQDQYVESDISSVDARKRVFRISKKRIEEVKSAVKMMRDFEKVYDELWAELGVDVSAAILGLERALHAKPLLSRLCSRFPKYSKLIEVA